MLETFRNLRREHKNRITEDEVVARLSYHVWKTTRRILEEVIAVRQKEGRELPATVDECILVQSPTLRVSLLLMILGMEKLVDMKQEDQLTGSDLAWASKSEGPTDEDFAKFLLEHGWGSLYFYRLKGGSNKRKPEEEIIPEGALAPRVI
jgi:hypothetical protein